MQYVRVISLDFSKAFDTVRHASIAESLSRLPLKDSIFNWFINYFDSHCHSTNFKGHISNPLSINAGVFQGSAVGPPLFLINGCELKPKFSQNYLDKYADDSYLIVGASNEGTVLEELAAIEKWAIANNMKLNQAKSKEMIFYNSKKALASISAIPVTQGLERALTLKILGITIKGDFSIEDHVSNICNKASQNFYVLKILRNSGLLKEQLFQVFNALVVSKMAYAASSWSGLLTQNQIAKLQSVLNKAVRWGFTNEQSVVSLFTDSDTRLFENILKNNKHVLHHLLPPVKETPYHLRASTSHGRLLPIKNNLLEKNFLIRMLYKDVA